MEELKRAQKSCEDEESAMGWTGSPCAARLRLTGELLAEATRLGQGTAPSDRPVEIAENRGELTCLKLGRKLIKPPIIKGKSK